MKEIIKRLKELGEYLGDTCSGNEVMDIKYNLESAIAKHESDSELLNLYKQALTKSVCLHKGLLPQGHKYSTCMLNGNVVVTQTKELTK